LQKKYIIKFRVKKPKYSLSAKENIDLEEGNNSLAEENCSSEEENIASAEGNYSLAEKNCSFDKGNISSEESPRGNVLHQNTKYREI